MNNHYTNHLALNELYSCQAYLKRLFYSLCELSCLGQDREVQKSALFLKKEIESFWDSFILKDFLPKEQKDITLGEVQKFIHESFQAFESILKVNFWGPQKSCKLTADFLNLFYEKAHLWHKLIDEKTLLKIQFPCLFAGEEKKLRSKKSHIPHFFINTQKLFKLSTQRPQQNKILFQSVQEYRNKNYQKLLQEGQLALADKQYAQALKSFKKSLRFKSCAEALGLISWCYGLLKNYSLAKKFSLEAIEKDPNYGPPYNDFGHYLLQEKKPKESLQWFEMAKAALNYPGRDHSYVNAGRAYLMLKDIPKALEEFTKALALNPCNPELKKTTKKLKNLWENSKDSLKNSFQSDLPL